jgi:predicted nuclease of predicted toxin-antitoxin system
MRVLLDECVPRALRNDIPDHEVQTVAEVGWAGVKNGELLRLAATVFDVLITVDRNLEYQQSLTGVSLAVIVIHAASNDIIALRPLMPTVLDLIPQAERGAVTHVRGGRSSAAQ